MNNFVKFILCIIILLLFVKYGSNSPNGSNTPNKSFNHPNSQARQVTVGSYEVKQIPAEFYNTSNTYNIFSDIFNSKKIFIVYTYIPGSDCPYLSQEYHDNVADYVKKGSNSIYYVDYPISSDHLNGQSSNAYKKLDPEYNGTEQEKKYTFHSANEVEEFNKKMEKKQAEQQNINNVQDFLWNCMANACIINPSRHEYIYIPDRNFSTLKNALDSYNR